MRVRLTRAVVLDMKSEQAVKDGVRIWVSGESGSGKSSAAMLIAAQLIEQGGQVIILDAHGEYGALALVRPNEVVRFGYGGEGPAGPVTEASVELCKYIVSEGKSLLLDLSHWTDLYPKKLDTFVLEFIRELYALRKAHPKQTLLVVEEAQNFIPQQQRKDQYENVLVFLGCITGGRKFGLNFLLASQRSALVDSNAIAGCNVRIFLRISELSDWKKVKPHMPPKLRISFNATRASGIKFFETGEAVITARWFPEVRARLLEPEVELRKPMEEL